MRYVKLHNHFFFSRDPNADTTLHLFDKCIQWCFCGEFSEEDVNEAKLMTIAEVSFTYQSVRVWQHCGIP